MDNKIEVVNKNNKIGNQFNANTITNNIQYLIYNPPPVDPNANVEFHFPRLVETFRGRDVELAQLRTWVFEEKKTMLVVSGLPGYGKSELVKHFARYCKNEKLIKNILWINSETRDSLEHSFRELLKWQNERTDLDTHSMIQKVHQRFIESSIFVFDNARSRQSILDFEPQHDSTRQCLCMVTSHVQDWGDDIPSLLLLPLSSDAAVEVLRAVLQNRFKDEEEEIYKDLANVLSCVPLALQVSAAYVRQEMLDLREEFDLREYVDSLKLSCEQYIEKAVPEFSANPYNISIFESVKKSIFKIQNMNNERSRLALNVLHICAYLNPDQIFSPDLANFPYIHNLLLNNDKRKDFMRALTLLDNYAFISFIQNQVTIHRLIQEILILYQNDIVTENYNKFYFACLDFLLTNFKSVHRYFVLKFADKRINTFQKFYSQKKLTILSTNAFFIDLVVTGCKIFLIEIFNDLGNGAADVINEHYLLHNAVKCRQEAVMELLLARSADVNKRYDSGDNALHIAGWVLNMRALEMLIDKTDVNAKNEAGDSVMHAVVIASGATQHISHPAVACEALRQLAEHNANKDAVTLRGWTLLHFAAQAYNRDLVQFLVNDFHLHVNALDAYDRTPLYHVSEGKDTDRERRLRTAEALLGCGARLDIVDFWERTPAQHARFRGLEYLATYLENPSAEYIANQTSDNASVLKRLIVAGDTSALSQKLDDLKDHAIQNINKFCLLQEAISHRKYDVLKMLIDRGADIDSKGDGRFFPLYVAVDELEKRSVEILVTNGADVNAVDVSGDSVLLQLVQTAGLPEYTGRQDEVCDMLRYLVDHGAQTDAVGRNCETMLHYAAVTLQPDLIQFLIREFNLDVNAVDVEQETPLYWVSVGLDYWKVEEARGISSATCLLENGARLDIVDDNGMTPAEHARAAGFDLYATFLEDSEGQWRRCLRALRNLCVRMLCYCRHQYANVPQEQETEQTANADAENVSEII